MRKLQAALLALVVCGLVIVATLQHRGQRQLRAENEALRQQIAEMAAESEALSNRLQQPAPATTAEQTSELLRLRSEVTLLRQQTNTIGRLKEENLRLQSAAAAKSSGSPEDEQLRFEGMAVRMVDTGKRIGLALRIYANDHGDVFATDLLSVTNELADVPKERLDGFELVNVGTANPNNPQAILARERAPRRTPQGAWERTYVLCDGSVQRVKSPDGNFDGWEQPNKDQVLELRRPINMRTNQ